MPFIYVPSDHFKVITESVNNLYGSNICSNVKGQCWFNMPCSSVSTRSISLFLRLYDSVGGQFAINLMDRDLLIPGNEVGEDTSRCYLPFFYPLENGPADTWKLGNIVLKKYYVILDMTPFSERFEDYIQVGISELN
jgi:hypothetical protein